MRPDRDQVLLVPHDELGHRDLGLAEHRLSEERIGLSGPLPLRGEVVAVAVVERVDLGGVDEVDDGDVARALGVGGRQLVVGEHHVARRHRG